MSTIGEKYQRCLEKMKEISTLSSVGGLLAWDQETKMPERAGNARAEQSAVLAGVIHERFIDPELGDLLHELHERAEELSDDEAVIVREKLRDYEKSTKLPAELVQELARLSSLSQSAWIKARMKSDFASFAPWLEKTVAIKRRQAEAYGYEDNPYDPLLDDYEPHMTVKELDPIIENLRKGLVPIVSKIIHADASIETDFLSRPCPIMDQKAVCKEIMGIMGMDPNASRLDESAHPFSIGISSPVDVRITIRYQEDNLVGSISNVMHEGGHALYEQGIDERFVGTPLGESVSLGIHESQSRLWENIIGRGRAFAHFILPRLQEVFPDALGGVSPEAFYRGINKVASTPIRVDADEVTYNLHVVLRYELEKALINDELRVADLPAAWNEKMRGYLELTPKDDAQGVLQDTHWALGMFGYFPTYSLGNLCASQFWSALKKDIPDVNDRIARGECATILPWLREKIHHNGRRYTTMQLVKRVSGEGLSASHFLDYLMEKYGEIYGIGW